MIVIAFYKFTRLDDYVEARSPLLDLCKENGVKGTILLAREGINGTISGAEDGIQNVVAWLRGDPRLADLEYKVAHAGFKPFYRMKVRLKKEIVTMGVEDLDPNQTVGTYVEPRDWNRLIADPGVTLVDARNDYEVKLGTFEGAVDPKTRSFHEFPDYVDENLDPKINPKVAMFCTGGIRCEKATAYLIRKGFKKVYHLKGGILKYLESVPEPESKWKGECFVFDNRVTVDHRLRQGHYELCHACRRPLSMEDRRSDRFQEGVSCPSCFGTFSEEKLKALRERQKQTELARMRGEEHIGKEMK